MKDMAAGQNIKLAVEVLSNGGVIAHPTETIFGLGAAIDSPEALRRLLSIKGRDHKKGFIILIPSREMLSKIVQPDSLLQPVTQALMDRFWPGPLTLVLPALTNISPQLTGGSGYIALRHSSSTLVAELLEALGGAIVSTSANRSGGPALLDRQQVIKEFGSELGCVVSGPSLRSPLPSTVLKVTPQGSVELLRSGAVASTSIQEVLQVFDASLVVAAPDGS
ncbi:MAG: threonylcarbamoyl-AMP synthase [Magnetococcales bacterium]|nr:threonylcarbamoyl-AMP synthase [Magnetococcales bacterium]